MLKLKNDDHKEVQSMIKKDRIIKFNKLKEGEKISILADPMFKCMFVNTNRIKYGAKLVSYFVEASYEELLESITLINSELDKKSLNSKGERCDYIASINDSLLNIEVNCWGSLYSLIRNLDFSHVLFNNKIKRGEPYDFTQVIQINLNNFSFKDIDDVITTFYLQDDKGNVLSKKLVYINVSIPNLREKCYTYGVERLSEVERYILSLVETDISKAKDIVGGDTFMLDSIEEQIKLGKDEKVFESYDRIQEMKDWGFEEGYYEGMEQGLEEGIEQGIEKGIEKGIEQGIESGKKDLARKMLLCGVDKNKISQSLNIDIEYLDEYLK